MVKETLFGELKFQDISVETTRTYNFPDGSSVIIDSPCWIHVKKFADTKHQIGSKDSHRVIDIDGVAHYIPPGWIHLSWKNREGVEPLRF